MVRLLRTTILTLLIGTLLLGRCLPCANLLGSPTAKSCCNKAGECQRIPSKDSPSSRPCPLQQIAITTVESSHVPAPDIYYVSLPPAEQASPILPHVSFERRSVADVYSRVDTRPHVYLLNSSFLI